MKLAIFIGVVLLVLIIARTQTPIKLQYKTFLLTLPKSVTRRQNFLERHDPSIPLEVVFSKDTTRVENVKRFKDNVAKGHYEKALEMHYDDTMRRPDITYFNLGAVGAYMGHVEVIRRARMQGVKYALVCEDNLLPTRRLYAEVQRVIDEKRDSFEAIFFHCIARLPDGKEGTLERVKWISSMKCYLVHVPNFARYVKHLRVMDNHIDNKMEDLIAKGARIFYKDMGHCARIDRSGASTIGHSDHDRKEFFSRRHPTVTLDKLVYGTW